MKRLILKWTKEGKMGSGSHSIKMDRKDGKMCARIG